ncbi:hypothetical protein PIB30_058820 [Stylosanthes scabra]|uniref:F-box domain-containing protein n=1 Tax=Stylosanthes scabra TaxID=79078 RepID=A0ABU6RL66_9FABA|nr:hypothetical protein [Stylosanthes scabra]
MMHRHRHSSGDAVLGDEDLLTEILLRLPVKNLLRCKCVCQKWKSLISEPQFGYRNTLGLCRNPKHNPYLYPSGIMVRPSNLALQKVNIIPFSNNTKNRLNHRLDLHNNKLDRHGELGYYFLRSCNGLLLWKSNPLKKVRSARRRELVQECSSFYVSNPATGHCVRIDRFGHDDSNYNSSFSKPYLAFEPCKSPHYKIIFFNEVVGEREDHPLTTKIQVSVYSSETSSWSKHDVILSSPNNDINIRYDNAPYCNGAIYWNSVYFDIDELCFKNLPTLPLTAGRDYFVRGCGRRNLHSVTVKNYEDDWKFDIWELKEDYSGWILRYHVDLTTLRLDIQANTFDVVLAVVCQPPNEDEDEESVLVIIVVDFKRIVSYNLKNRRSRIIHEGSAIRSRFSLCVSSSTMHGVLGDEDLLTEIFLRLPVKDLLRCKGVCKQWKCLISEPQFCYRHTLGLCRKHKHNPFLYSTGIILSRCPCRPSLRTLEKVHIIPFSNNNDNRVIPLGGHNKFDEQLENSFLRSCNGLLLLKSSPKEFGVQQGSFYVSNLTTGDCVRIDRFGHHDASLSKLYLAFEPWKSPYYKVIFFDKVVGNNREDFIRASML